MRFSGLTLANCGMHTLATERPVELFGFKTRKVKVWKKENFCWKIHLRHRIFYLQKMKRHKRWNSEREKEQEKYKQGRKLLWCNIINPKFINNRRKVDIFGVVFIHLWRLKWRLGNNKKHTQHTASCLGAPSKPSPSCVLPLLSSMGKVEGSRPMLTSLLLLPRLLLLL